MLQSPLLGTGAADLSGRRRHSTALIALSHNTNAQVPVSNQLAFPFPLSGHGAWLPFTLLCSIHFRSIPESPFSYQLILFWIVFRVPRWAVRRSGTVWAAFAYRKNRDPGQQIWIGFFFFNF